MPKCAMCTVSYHLSCMDNCSCKDNNHEEVVGETKPVDVSASDGDSRFSSNPANRRGKSDRNLKDQQSTGRKRAAKLFPLDREASCEWQGKSNCGGGPHPIVGCISGLQEARHHGPDKSVTNNEEGNVHRICHMCIGTDMKVLTRDLDWVTGDKLSIGDSLVGFYDDLEGKLGQFDFTSTKITALQKVVEPSYKITLSNEDELISSHTHLWPTSLYGQRKPTWVKTEDLLNSKHHWLLKVSDTWDYQPTFDMGYLAGALDGEGSLLLHDRYKAIQFPQKDNEMMEKVYRILEPMVTNGVLGSSAGVSEGVDVLRVSNFKDVVSILGRCKPPRLMSKWYNFLEVGFSLKNTRYKIKKIEFIGNTEVWSISTTLNTFVTEGYATHNCHYNWHARNDGEYDWNNSIVSHHSPVGHTYDTKMEAANIFLKYMANKSKRSKIKD